jgi:hypothetical protein
MSRKSYGRAGKSFTRRCQCLVAGFSPSAMLETSLLEALLPRRGHQGRGELATRHLSRHSLGRPCRELLHGAREPRGRYSPTGGAAVRYLAAPRDFALAGLSGLHGACRTQVSEGRFKCLRRCGDRGANAPEHRCAFTRTAAFAEAFPSRFEAKHVHAVPGDITAEFRAVCRFLEIDLERLDVLQRGGDK